MSMRRRDFFSMLGGAALGASVSGALPGVFGSRAKAQDGPPLRFLTFFSPNGPISPTYWTPTGNGPGGAIGLLPEPMESLRAHKSQLTMLAGLNMPHPSQNHSAIGRLLTGVPNTEQPGPPPPGDPRFDASSVGNQWGEGISFDQFVAQQLGESALVLGVRSGDTDPLTRLSYTGRGAPVDPYANPVEAFNRAFGTIIVDETAEDTRRRMIRRASVLDAAGEQFALLRPRLGQTARLRLDRHADMLRELEMRVLAGATGGMACMPTPLASTPGGYDFNSPEHVVTTAELQMDIMAEAFACGVTRVGTIQVGNAGDTFGSRVYAPGIRMDGSTVDLGSMNEHNDVIHAFSDDQTTPDFAASLANRLDLERIYYTLFSRLLDRLAAIPEGDGTVLDNTVVMWCKSLGTDQSHKAHPMLFMLAGGRNAGLTPGRFIDHTDRTPNELYVGLARLFGIDIDTFGQWGSQGYYQHWGTTPIELRA